MANPSIPKYHHYVPRLLLAGFTDTGTREGTLHVFDRARGTWRESNIDRAGGENYLNDVDVEKALGIELEGPAATTIRTILANPGALTDEAVGTLAVLFAVQLTCPPSLGHF